MPSISNQKPFWLYKSKKSYHDYYNMDMFKEIATINVFFLNWQNIEFYLNHSVTLFNWWHMTNGVHCNLPGRCKIIIGWKWKGLLDGIKIPLLHTPLTMTIVLCRYKNSTWVYKRPYKPLVPSCDSCKYCARLGQ